MWLGMLRIPVVEDLLLGEFITSIAALLAVSKRHLRVSEGLHQAFQPIGIHRINMSAGYHNKLSVRFEDSLIQRIAKGEFVGLDVDDLHRVMGSNFQGAIGRT